MRNKPLVITVSRQLPQKSWSGPSGWSYPRPYVRPGSLKAALIEAICALHASGVEEVSISDLVLQLESQGRSARREAVRPLLSELSGGDHGGRRAPGSELVRLSRDLYRITGESGPLDTPRPAAERRGLTLDRALRSWMEERAASGEREFGLGDAATAVQKYGLTTTRATIKGVLASHFMFTGCRAEAGRRAVGHPTPTVNRVAHGRYRFVGQVRSDASATPHITALGARVLEVLARYQADGRHEVTCREIARDLNGTFSPQAIVRQLHQLHRSGAANVGFIGNNRSRSYVFEVPPVYVDAESPKTTLPGDTNRIPSRRTPSPSAA